VCRIQERKYPSVKSSHLELLGGWLKGTYSTKMKFTTKTFGTFKDNIYLVASLSERDDYMKTIF
jgi:hypothetical protein